jgi:hypothetical protein
VFPGGKVEPGESPAQAAVRECFEETGLHVRAEHDIGRRDHSATVLWTSPVRPGREHDTTCARAHDGLLDALTDWTDTEHAALADLGYEGENSRLTCPIKNTRRAALTVEQRTVNALHSATRALAERGNSLLKTTFKGLRRVTLCRGGSARSPPQPWSSYTGNTTAPHDHAIGVATENASLTDRCPAAVR